MSTAILYFKLPSLFIYSLNQPPNLSLTSLNHPCHHSSFRFVLHISSRGKFGIHKSKHVPIPSDIFQQDPITVPRLQLHPMPGLAKSNSSYSSTLCLDSLLIVGIVLYIWNSFSLLFYLMTFYLSLCSQLRLISLENTSLITLLGHILTLYLLTTLILGIMLFSQEFVTEPILLFLI